MRTYVPGDNDQSGSCVIEERVATPHLAGNLSKKIFFGANQLSLATNGVWISVDAIMQLPTSTMTTP